MNLVRHSTLSVLLGMCAGVGATDVSVEAAFPAAGISRVILRAGTATQATISTRLSESSIRVLGVASGGAKGYHSPDPTWKEPPASDWGLSCVGQAFGPTLVISSQNETLYIHHSYVLRAIKLYVPAGMEVVRESRKLDGNGSPNLSAP